jgi:hypothetical protein
MHDAREVYFVPLDAVVDPTEVRAAVAAGIGIPGQLGDRPLAPIVRALTNRRALLVLDNCEQVADACQELVASLLAACPTVTVLATTHIPLDLPDEQVFAIPPMGSGALRSNPFESDAVALFLDRASSVAGAYALTEHNAKVLALLRCLARRPPGAAAGSASSAMVAVRCHQHSRQGTGVLGSWRTAVSSGSSCRPGFAAARTRPLPRDRRRGRRSTLHPEPWRRQPPRWRLSARPTRDS